MNRARLAVIVMTVLLGGASLPNEDGFDRALAALAAGSRAAAIGDQGRLRSAALALQATAARPVAGDDLAALWLEQAPSASPPVMRDRALGPGYRTLRIDGGNAAVFEQTFLAGQRARVAVVPLRLSNFTMQVRETASPPVCHASPRRAQCDWVPAYTTRFTIEIRNPGRQPGEYVVMMQ